ncbi:probable methyltransferase-like protein 25 [Diadema antillarum]|uniref:probable methyltransferase-like protein 25 n=1 Tax=Diadema antillarum TaxID=105358 RepID=UPI003A8AC5EE
MEGIVNSLSKFKTIAEESTVSFFTRDMWTQNVASIDQKFADECLKLTDEELISLPRGHVFNNYDSDRRRDEFQKVENFCNLARNNRLNAPTCVDFVNDADRFIESSTGRQATPGAPAPAGRGGRGDSTISTGAEQHGRADEYRVNNELAKRIMGKKKSHEVAVMAHVCSAFSAAMEINQVIDIGSGKGYLGQFLSKQYGLTVASVDVSEINTFGALKRSNRLDKQWNGIIRNLAQNVAVSSDIPNASPQETKSGASLSNDNNRFKMDPGCDTVCNVGSEADSFTSNIPTGASLVSSSADDSVLSYSDKLKESCLPRLSSANLQSVPESLVSPLTTNFNCESVGSERGESSLPASQPVSPQSSSMVNRLASNPSTIPACRYEGNYSSPENYLSNDKLLSTTGKADSPAVSTEISVLPCHHVTNSSQEPDSDQGQSRSCQQSCQTETVNSEDVSDQRKLRKTREESGAFVSLTGYVDEETDIGDILGSDQEASHFDLTEPFMMVGLHTCGNLAPSMLRIFVANPRIQCLCGVGCCYHHVTEEFAKTDEWDREHPGVEMGTSYGFPMSNWLRERHFALGRGARMTACMAAERVAAGDSLNVKGLFYRAVLQVICKEHYVIPTRKQVIGKLAPKCKTFLEYTRRALKKLGLDESKLSDCVIEGYEERYRPFYRNLEAYNQLRASLAPSIEALILLDRLAYLREQPNVQMASIVPLFDPVTSPRCYAILAVKSS